MAKKQTIEEKLQRIKEEQEKADKKKRQLQAQANQIKKEIQLETGKMAEQIFLLSDLSLEERRIHMNDIAELIGEQKNIQKEES
ncbi:hypothetical protein HCJ46_17160 [Listeria booriae]|uniref:hypothetical protein n=1 Tax=Listeria booriae TaxID=1552123 RepID=UPI001629983C|nr:hypothetical protein [Listeria booriae]MBC1920483.1 hypothetical protein [Listeria booriae]